MEKTCLTLLLLIIQISFDLRAQSIPPNFFSLNGWMTNEIGSSTLPDGPGNFLTPDPIVWNPSGKLYNILTPAGDLIEISGTKYLRYGGTANDINFPSNIQFQTFVTNAKNNGFQSLIQIPFLNQWFNDGNVTTLASAQNVTYQNRVTAIVNMLKASPYFVKYWSIGNEPDLYHTAPFNKNSGVPLTFGQIADYFKAISDVIKTADPNAIVVGPDLASPHSSSNDLMEKLISGASSSNITAISPITLKPYCDIWAFHTYPFSGLQNRAQVIAQPAGGFKSSINAIRDWIIPVNSYNPNLKIAVTELNVNFLNETPIANNTYLNEGANSFLAGQWMAEVFANALDNPTGGASVEFMFPWSVHESGGGRTERDLGLLDGAYPNHKGRSTYWHLNMMANNFKGKFYMGQNFSGTDAANVKAFASRDCRGIAIMIMNQNQGSGFNVNYGINGTSPSISGSDVAFNVNIGTIGLTYTEAIGPEETKLILMDPCGKIKGVYTYNSATHNQSYIAPTYVASSTGRFCRCFDFTTYNPSNSTAKCATPGGGSGHFNDDNLNKSYSLIGNVGSVTGTLKISGNSVLTIQDAEVVFAPGAKIEVQPGSKLIIKNSYLHGCEGGQKWTGMDIMGNNILSGQIIIDGSQIWDAQVAVKAFNVKNISITGTSFYDGITAIDMERVQGFQIENNEISNFTYGIKTLKTIISSSTIKENYFYNVKYAIFSESDNHAKLDIACNKFEKYSDYAIYSDNSIMKDQGTLANGAGNEFISNSTQLNHKLRHNGNPMNYYYDPSNPVSLNTSSGLKAIAQMAGADGTCSRESARLLDNTSEKENSSEISKSLMINAFDFKVYPNPFNNSFIVTTNSINASLLEIYNVYGSLIYSVKPENEKTEITLEKYTAGVYFVKMSNHQGSVIKKIIKE